MKDYHRGWFIYQGPSHPVTGQWRATRYGVGMCAGTREQLIRMIDQKVNDEIQERGYSTGYGYGYRCD